MNAIINCATAPCSRCALRRLCRPMPDGLPRRRRVAKGESLYRAGDPFVALYAVHAGFFKLRGSGGASERILGFEMAGELLGLDGLGTGTHSSDAVALEDSRVCVVPYERLLHQTLSATSLQREFHALLGRELDRRSKLAGLLSGTSADARIAFFLGDLAQRVGALGFSAHSLNLRMTRQEIGSYLGLTLETVSRCLSKLQASGVLRVSHRAIEIADPASLSLLAEEAPR